MRKKFRHKLRRRLIRKEESDPSSNQDSRSPEKTLKIFIEEAKDISNSEEQIKHIKKKRSYNLRKHSVGRRRRRKEIKRGRKRKKLKKKGPVKLGLFLNDHYIEEYDPDIQDNILNPKIKFFINVNCSSSEESENEGVLSIKSSDSDGENKWSLNRRLRSRYKSK